MDQNSHQCDRNSPWLPFPLTYGCWRRQFHDEGTGSSDAEQQTKKFKVLITYLKQIAQLGVRLGSGGKKSGG